MRQSFLAERESDIFVHSLWSAWQSAQAVNQGLDFLAQGDRVGSLTQGKQFSLFVGRNGPKFTQAIEGRLGILIDTTAVIKMLLINGQATLEVMS